MYQATEMPFVFLVGSVFQSRNRIMIQTLLISNSENGVQKF
jgi:hypothetical protein